MTPEQVVVPPVAQPAGAGIYEIVDGCKRVLYMQHRHKDRCMCAITTTPLDSRAAGLLRIMFNRNRPRTLDETLCYVRWLKENVSSEGYRSIAEELGFTQNQLQEAHRLLGCAPFVVRAVADGALHSAVIEDFSRLGESGQRAFLTTFAGLKLSRQTQRELIRWLPDIAATTGRPVADILAEDRLQRILRDGRITDPRKIDKVRHALFERRFPRLAHAHHTWRTASARHNPDPRRVSFVPDQSFEKDRLEMRITLRSAGEAEKLFGKLASVPRDAWRLLLRPWNEDSGTACR